jgi:hypothetical protein
MHIITIANEVSETIFSKIEVLVENTLHRSSSWNGASIIVKRGDFTCINGEETIESVKLLIQINNIIQGE